jgi:hypothetical protein
MYQLTPAGRATAAAVFGPAHRERGAATTETTVVLTLSESDAVNTAAFNLLGVAAATGLQYRRQEMDFGTIGFEGEDGPLDAIISVVKKFSDQALVRLARVPMGTWRILLVLKEPPESIELQLDASRFEVVLVTGLKGDGEIARFVEQVAGQAERGPWAVASGTRSVARTRDIWQRQLLHVPGIGPSLAACIAEAFKTPADLMDAMMGDCETVRDDVRSRWGRGLARDTMEVLQQMFTASAE